MRSARLVGPDGIEAALDLALLVSVEVALGALHARLPLLARACRVPLDRGGDEPTGPAELPAWAERRRQIAEVVFARVPWEVTCLRRSLVIGARLARLGPRLSVGARPTPGGVDAHAWVSVERGWVTDPGEGFRPLRAAPRVGR